jgi:hypothetical protein
MADWLSARIAVLSAVIVGSLALFADVAQVHATGPLRAQASAVIAVGSGPLVKGNNDLEELLKELEEEAVDAATVAPSDGEPLSTSNRTIMHDNVDRVEAIIDQILDPAQHPSLNPADAGDVDPSVVPVTLEQYADDTAGLAEAAYVAAVTGPGIDDELIGTNLKTIESLLAGYRDEIEAAPSQ